MKLRWNRGKKKCYPKSRSPCHVSSCKAGGGWELLDIYAKCKALLLSRMHSQGTRAGSVQAVLLRKWNLDTHPANPPNIAAYPPGMAHLRAYATVHISHFFFLSSVATALLGPRLPRYWVFESQKDRLHSTRLLWTRDRSVAQTSTWQHTVFTRDRYPWSWRDSNPQSQQANGHRPTP